MFGLRRLPVALVVLAALVLALLGGCGGSSASTRADNAYISALNQAQTTFTRTNERLARGVKDQSFRESRATLRAYVDAVNKATADMQRIDPPEPVAQLHHQLVGYFGTYAEEVKSVVSSIQSGDRTRVVRSQREVRDASSSFQANVNKTIAAINDKLGRG